MSTLDIARLAEVLASIFALHCILIDTSAYYRALIDRLSAKREPQFSDRLAADITEALKESGL